MFVDKKSGVHVAIRPATIISKSKDGQTAEIVVRTIVKFKHETRGGKPKLASKTLHVEGAGVGKWRDRDGNTYEFF